MPVIQNRPYQKVIGRLLLALAVPLLWWVYKPVQAVVVQAGLFLFIHTAVELVATVVAVLVFVTGYRAMVSVRNGAVVMLGIAFLGVAVLDWLHALSYTGMPDAVTANSPQKSIYFWLCARLIAATALLVYALLPQGAVVSTVGKRMGLLCMLGLVGLLAYVGLVWPDRVPALFVTGKGLTPLKVALEWLVIAMHLCTLGVFWHRRETLAEECVMAVGFSVSLSVVSELFFTMLGIRDQDAANLLGHLYKVAAYLYLFHATFSEALRRPLERLRIQHVRESQVLAAAPDGVLWVNSIGTILMVNPAMEALSGYSADELLGHGVDIFLPAHLRPQHAESMRKFFTAPHPRSMGTMGGIDLKLICKDGRALPVDISLGHWQDGGEWHAIAYVRDMSERKDFEQSLQHQISHDDLTGLPNRLMLKRQLDQAMAHAKRCTRQVAVLFLDLDDFKSVNDSFGHASGDQLLVLVARRLRAALREEDTLARMGGDEFAILLSDLESPDEALRLTDKLLKLLGTPFNLTGQELFCGGSMGLAFYPHDAQDADSLLRFADMAMYQVKRDGRGGYACYSSAMNQQAHEKLLLHARLKEAIHQGRLQLYYQPQVQVDGGHIVGAEALLRWHDEVLGEVSPTRFIPVAESTGLILPLADWVLETACRQIAAWVQMGVPLRVAVNFSVHQFRQSDLIDKVSSALRRSGAPAHLLEVEVTESMAMERPEQAREQLAALVQLGCTVALDDFGTGYSSLSYLKALPVSVIKIDKSFVKDIPHGLNDVKISKSIIALAHSLEMTLVAEGIETEPQLAFFREHGCENYQGWLFARAMTGADLTVRLQAARSALSMPTH